MSRSVKEIYEMMLRDKESREELSGLTSSSAGAVWRVLLWVVASSVRVVEDMWDVFRAEVEDMLSREMPHRPRWYVEKVKQYMRGMTLPEGSDEYDVSGMSADEISSRRVVKYAAAIESRDMSILYVKVAGEDAEGRRVPLSSVVAVNVYAYLQEIKDVGVRIELVNKAADGYRCVLRVLYDAILDPGVVREGVVRAVSRYVQELPFAGEYNNMSLIDAVQVVDGVKIAELLRAEVRESGVELWSGVNMRYTPVSGYMEVTEVDVELEAYSVYEGV